MKKMERNEFITAMLAEGNKVVVGDDGRLIVTVEHFIRPLAEFPENVTFRTEDGDELKFTGNHLPKGTRIEGFSEVDLGSVTTMGREVTFTYGRLHLDALQVLPTSTTFTACYASMDSLKEFYKGGVTFYSNCSFSLQGLEKMPDSITAFDGLEIKLREGMDLGGYIAEDEEAPIMALVWE